jgi:AcrR family transcriptional regulator
MGTTRENIKAASIDLFYEKGYFATSLSEIAANCRIQKASIYYHYPSKEALLYDILRSTMDELTDHLEDCIAGIDGVEDRMRRAVRGHVHFHLERQKENFIANSEMRGISPEHYGFIVEKRDAYEKVFQDLIRQGSQEGAFAGCDEKILSYAILTLCTSGAIWFKSAGRLSVEKIATIYEDFIISGLKRGDMDDL